MERSRRPEMSAGSIRWSGCAPPPVAPGVSFVASGDVGGFGIGSKFSWQALAALNYDFCVRNNVTWSGMVGYKALFVDYSQGSGIAHYEYDMTMHGPIIGVTARF